MPRPGNGPNNSLNRAGRVVFPIRAGLSLALRATRSPLRGAHVVTKTTILIFGAAAIGAAFIAASLTLPGNVAAQPQPRANAGAEVAAPAAMPERDAYLKALDSLSDQQAEMVPVVLAAVGELACDGLEVDRRKTAAFIAVHAGEDSPQGRTEAADAAKSTTDVLLGPWLTYVHKDSGAFCRHAYALKDSGRDLWKN